MSRVAGINFAVKCVPRRLLSSKSRGGDAGSSVSHIEAKRRRRCVRDVGGVDGLRCGEECTPLHPDENSFSIYSLFFSFVHSFTNQSTNSKSAAADEQDRFLPIADEMLSARQCQARNTLAVITSRERGP